MEITSHQLMSSCSTTCCMRPGNLLFRSNYVSFQYNKGFLISTHSQGNKLKSKQLIITSLAAAQAVGAQRPSTDSAEGWLLVPVGDGDSRHIGFKVEMPAAFEISSNEVTVGRVADKADVVIPVATVSGVHARIQIKAGKLLVTDLDSTNGTFIGEKRLQPGIPYPAPAGSYVTFGDTNLAIFRVSKLERAEAVEEPAEEESESKPETE
ncbi:hypothetical protein ACFE04_016688 [Oxalis oulophora]